jgi:hypothetical protein
MSRQLMSVSRWIERSQEPGRRLRAGTGDRDPHSRFEDPERDDAAVLAVLSQHTPAQPWWLGYLETGIGPETIFYDVPKVTLYSDWQHVLVEAGYEQAGSWRAEWVAGRGCCQT